MNESGFIGKVHKLLSPTVYKWKVADRFRGGVADCWYSGPGGDLWVEYKYVPAPKRTVRAGLSALQKQWLRQRSGEGRHVAVVVGVPGGALLLTEPAAWEAAASMDAAQTIETVVAYIHAHTLRDGQC